MKISFIAIILSVFIFCGCAHPDPSSAKESAQNDLLLPDGSVIDPGLEHIELSSVGNIADYIAVLNELPSLKSLSFSEPVNAECFAAFTEELPGVEINAEISAADIVFSINAEVLDLKGKTAAQLRELLPVLPYMNQLKFVDLGDATGSPELSLHDLGPLQQLCPQVDFSCNFELYGQIINTCDTALNLAYIPVEDEGAAVLEAMKYMPRLEYLDMDSCGVKDENMAKIRDAYPEVKVVWRIWFGKLYSVRTDVECILASKPDVAGCLVDGSTDSLIYCTDVKYLDLGHNPDLHTIDFVRYMPKLEVAILAMDNWSDCSALAECPQLEYLEIQTTQVSDIGALSNLKNLKHLNICYLFDLTDISPLYGLTQLERLWIGCITPIPDEQIAQMQLSAPDCVINTTTLDPTDQEWRYSRKGGLVPRYELLREQFGGYSNYAFAFYWNDPLCREVY